MDKDRQPAVTAVAQTTQPEPTSTQPKQPKLLTAKHRRHLWPQSWSHRKKRCFSALLVILILFLAGVGYAWYRHAHPTAKQVAAVKHTKQVAAQPTTVASELTGVQVSPDLAKRAITGVMIENSPDARPQSGLNQAGVVFEAVAEGGITRFLALFQENKPDYIGPVRSSRPYYLDWLLPFNASYAHVGGSPEALSQIKSLSVRDLDQFANGGSYQRVTTRYAPHNVYTSTTKLDALEQTKGYSSSTFTGFVRKAKEAPLKVPTAASIDVAMSGYLYNSHYDYAPSTNNYNRSEGGKPHTDEKSGAQLSPKVVVALVMPSGLEPDGTHSSYNTVGSGSMYVFQDGSVTQGTWQKTSRTAQFTFTDSTGKPLKLNPGQTWVTAVNAATAVTYRP